MAWSLSWTSRRQFPQGYIGGALGFCGLKTILCPGGYSFSEDNDKGFGFPGGGPRLIILLVIGGAILKFFYIDSMINPFFTNTAEELMFGTANNGGRVR